MKQAQLKTDELNQLKWLLGQVLTLVALWTLAFLDLRVLPLLILAAGVVSLTLFFPKLPGVIPAFFWKAVTPLLVLIILTDFILAGGDTLPPLIRMITLLAIVRCLSYRTRREDLQLVLLCLFMAVISGVLTLSMVFALQIVIFTPLAMVLLFLINLLESEDDKPMSRETWRGFRWWGFLSRLRLVMDIRMLGFTGGLFALVAACSSVIFVTIPRFQFDQAIPFFQLETRSLIGFSDTVNLGGVTEIVEDNRVAFRLDPPTRESIPDNPYFRMLVLDYYSDGRFSLSQSVKNDPAVLHAFQNAWLSGGLGMRVPDSEVSKADQPPLEYGSWTFYLEGGISKYLPLVGPFQTLRFQNRQEGEVNWSFLVAALDSAKNGVFSYQALTMGPTNVLASSRVDSTILPTAEPLIAERSEDVWADLSYPITQVAIPIRNEDAAYLRKVVQEITGGEDLSAREFSRRTIEYLHARHSYSLQSQVPVDDRDKVVAWLQEESPGHCEYFAGAFTLLARTAGFPTRLVIGFNGGSWNTVENYFVVRNRNAHAWCEIFNEERQWVRVDPTPGASRLEETGLADTQGRGLPEESGWDAYLDSLRILWYRSIVNFDDRSQMELATRVKDVIQDLIKDFRASADQTIADFKDWWNQPLSWNRMLLLGAIFLVFLALYIVYLQRFRLQNQLLKTRFGRRLLGNADPLRRKAGRLLYRFEGVVDRQWPADRDWPDSWKKAHLELLSLRFGDLQNYEEAGRIFQEAKERIREVKRSA